MNLNEPCYWKQPYWTDENGVEHLRDDHPNKVVPSWVYEDLYRKIKEDPEYARRMLIEIGIIDENGKLTEPYRSDLGNEV